MREYLCIGQEEKRLNRKMCIYKIATAMILFWIQLIFATGEQVQAETRSYTSIELGNYSEGLVAIGKSTTTETGIIYDGIFEAYEDEIDFCINKGSFGYWDERGKNVIPQQFDYAWEFIDGIAAVEKDGKIGFIDKSGTVVVDYKYERMKRQDGFIFVYKRERNEETWHYEEGWIIIDKAGNELTEYCFKEIFSMNEKWAIGKNSRGEVLLNKNGEEISDYFPRITYVEEGMFSVGYPEHWGIMNENGELVTECKYSGTFEFDGEVTCVSDENDRFGLVNKQGKEILKCKNDRVWQENGFVIYRKDDLSGLLNNKGEKILPRKYKYIKCFENGMLCVRGKKDCALFSSVGEQLTDFKYSSIDEFSEGVAVATIIDVSTNSTTYFLLNQSGKEIAVLPQNKYSFVSSFRNGIAYVLDRETQKVGIINKKGKEIIKCQYDRATNEDLYFGKTIDKLTMVKKDDKWGMVGKNGKVIIECQYDEYDKYKNGLTAVRKGSKYGFIDQNGSLVSECQYDSIYRYMEYDFVRVKKKNKVGYVDKNGKEVVKCQYDMLIGNSKYCEDQGAVLLIKGNDYYIVNLDMSKEIKPHKIIIK